MGKAFGLWFKTYVDSKARPRVAKQVNVLAANLDSRKEA